jgi:hypothetical protein
MLDNLKSHTDHIEFYEITDVPLYKDSFLVSDDNLEKIEKQWVEFLASDCDYEKWVHPNRLMDYIPCSISSVTETHLNITILLDRSSRFHTISKSLPTKFFKTAFKVFSSEKRPFIVVDQKWFRNLRSSIYSAYVLIDFVGIRSLLNENGEFPSAKLNSIKSIVDKFSDQNKDLTFLTCADNIIIKSGWTLNSNLSKYQPEKLIKSVYQLMTQIKNDTEISSYAILTQGANYVDETNLTNGKTPENHFFISSISVPFIEAFEIDENVRKRIREGEIDKMQFYIENSFYTSTKRKHYSSEEPSWFKKLEFKSKKLNTRLSYSGLNYQNICELIDLNE